MKIKYEGTINIIFEEIMVEYLKLRGVRKDFLSKMRILEDLGEKIYYFD